MSDRRNEELWNEDLIDILNERFPDFIIFKGRILKDIFLQKNKTGKYELQLGFFDQDIVIYKKGDLMDVKDIQECKSIRLHNNNSNAKNTIIIPSIIIELKYDGVNTHGIITYSNIASDIKAIFPKCKYIFALRHSSGSSDNKFLRNGKNFDNIIYFDNNENYGKKYVKGQFREELKKSKQLNDKFESLVDFIELIMKSPSNSFLK
ncbi:MAG: hypothetical protein K9N07_10095 [Candidatus Cloacimonetes bacterium]|nr:hypothetical protein [Candidatus Cloacimonadota bacterium]